VYGAAQARSVVPSRPSVMSAAAPAAEDSGTTTVSGTAEPPARPLRVRPVCRTFRGEPSQISLVRHFVRRYLAGRHDCPGEALDDILLCVTELATNAVRHSLSGLGGHFTVVLYVSGSGARVEVIDGGPRQCGGRSDMNEDDDFLLPGGLGLRLVSAHSDQMGYAERAQRGVAWFERAWASDTWS